MKGGAVQNWVVWVCSMGKEKKCQHCAEGVAILALATDQVPEVGVAPGPRTRGSD